MNEKVLSVFDEIKQEMLQLPGHTGFYYQNLVTGEEYGIRDLDCFDAASVIKLPILLHILSECAAGEMNMDTTLTITEADKVPICGALTLFSGDVQADIQTLCRLMISISDNTATNKLIDFCGIPAIQNGLKQMGLHTTKLTRKLFDQEASGQGLKNSICPREIGHLLSRLYHEDFVSPWVCNTAIDMLLLQQVDHKMNGRVCGEVPIAHKTGEDDHLSNDVGIVYAQEPFVLCFAGHDTDVYPWEDLMRRAAYDLVKAHG